MSVANRSGEGVDAQHRELLRRCRITKRKNLGGMATGEMVRGLTSLGLSARDDSSDERPRDCQAGICGSPGGESAVEPERVSVS
jgi:hypothetical protein